MQMTPLITLALSFVTLSVGAARSFHSYLPVQYDNANGCATSGCTPVSNQIVCGKDCASTASVVTCNNGFDLSEDGASCVCPFPLTVCYGQCGTFPNGCPTTIRRRAPSPSPLPSSRLGLFQASTSLFDDARAICGAGESLCGVFGGNRESFECVNTLSRLESCGGCMIPPPFPSSSRPSPVGVDCSALDGVLDVSCIAGKCAVTRCENGFIISLAGTECLPRDNTSPGSNPIPTRTIALPFGRAKLNLTMSLVGAIVASPTSIVTDADPGQAQEQPTDSKDHPDLLYIPAHFPEIPAAPSPTALEGRPNLQTPAPDISSPSLVSHLIDAAGVPAEGLAMDISVSLSMSVTMAASQTMSS